MNSEDKAYVIELQDSDNKVLKSILIIGYENAKRHLKYIIDQTDVPCFTAKLYEVEQ